MNFPLQYIEKLASALPDVKSEILQKESAMPVLRVDAKSIHKVIDTVVNGDLKMPYLNNISGLHLTETKEDGTLDLLGFEILYVFSSMKDFSSIAVRVDLPEQNPAIDSIDDLSGSANWFEREIFDLLGVHFNNSSDLRRIMLPEDWEGHPLRKDYKENTVYNGIPTTRDNELDKVRIE